MRARWRHDRESWGDGERRPFGTQEGLGLYLNGVDLPDEVYAETDVNFLYGEIARLLGEQGEILSHWVGPTETAFYLYGDSFAQMQQLIADLVASYPLCQQSRQVQIA